MGLSVQKRWQYLVGRFVRRKSELWFESSEHARVAIAGGIVGYAHILNLLGAEGWELVHCDDSAPRTIGVLDNEVAQAWGDMIFKREMPTPDALVP
ncbi:MAG: hypothetical protein Q8Q09_24735 [Deltaproteobacteria bacterium]|nr:hypothetical protein [Deltaproteobacteria bacterium]